ncbi:ribonuclease H-like domain-containing protein, partial [Tanacetum coccineum]
MFYSMDVKFYETISVFQASSPNDDGGEPSGSNIGSESESDDTAREQSSDDDQGSMQIGEEDFSEGNVFENFDVPTNMFNTEETMLDMVLKNLLIIHGYLLKTVDLFPILMSFEPKSYEEAALDKNWVQAMNDEMEALHENNSWDLVELLKNRKCLFQLDVNNAFLYGNLDEDVYTLPPPGYFDKNETKVCKLKRSLYGLKQAPRQWNNRFSEALIKNDFKQSGHDHSLYTKESGGNFVALLVYVDDIMLTGNNINEINKVKTFLKSKFKIKDLSELKYFLGIESPHASSLTVSHGPWLKGSEVTNLLPAELFCDNSAAIQITANPVMHEKTKHFDVDVHIIREKVASGLIKAAKIDSENQTVDIFTKGIHVS